ncbi:glycoside hydrolase family 127 protein [Actinoplanes sichuanensis]|uniref:Beta-L-arabinofuranosidase domain-containing protein n=1 Tax=Actinoplanes sichuanensis TaxID=512349 RepID=A0ABW4ASS2_9ACTN|nr:beta-L-arabinofuranosidase domain-containing protein [Actinoplanes sichuanensis]BEL05262.1 glycoside hydrolase family 127 protein [Actinoplanes sichuanensis]
MLPLTRRSLLGAAAGGAALSVMPGLPAVAAETGVSAYQFPLGQVKLTAGRLMDNQSRTLTYLRLVDVDRLLYVFRANHGLSTGGAAANGGWDAPTFPFRSHVQGHFLTAWAQAWAVLGDTVCRDKANYMVAELAKCQASNGYLSGFPEADITAVHNRTLTNGNVPYYCIHKTLAGLLDVWRLIGGTQARDVLLKFAAWVDTRTAALTTAQMQAMLQTEFGGMNAVLTDLYQQTNDSRWLTVARRFDHAVVFDPLAAGTDSLNGLHANTQVPKWIGAAREYKATGTTRYRDIARNAWNITVGAHTYAIGGNSQAEHFRPAGAIAGYLTNDTCEHCNSVNMLRLTNELYVTEPDRAAYFDFYEQALLNHVLGAQNPASANGHVTYFTPLRPGGRRGVGPAWGGGTWSTDYGTFWCCQGTGVEVNTRLAESIYFYSGTTLTVNLFAPSVLTWAARGITVTQTTTFPESDTSTLKLTGTMSGSWSIRVRIPSWTSGATITVNGTAVTTSAPGTYTTITRTWAANDTIVVRLPMRIVLRPANDNPDLQAITYGPVVLAGNYGDTALTTPPTLTVSSVTRTTATANGSPVNLVPFYNAHAMNYNVYWMTAPTYKLVNNATGLVLGVKDMSVADGGLAVMWGDTGTLDHRWVRIADGTAVRFRNVNSGKVLGVQDMSTADNAVVLQWADNGTADHRWTLVDQGNGIYKIRNVNSGKLLAVLNGGTAWGVQVVQDADNGSADNLWRLTAI